MTNTGNTENITIKTKVEYICLKQWIKLNENNQIAKINIKTQIGMGSFLENFKKLCDKQKYSRTISEWLP